MRRLWRCNLRRNVRECRLVIRPAAAGTYVRVRQSEGKSPALKSGPGSVRKVQSFGLVGHRSGQAGSPGAPPSATSEAAASATATGRLRAHFVIWSSNVPVVFRMSLVGTGIAMPPSHDGGGVALGGLHQDSAGALVVLGPEAGADPDLQHDRRPRDRAAVEAPVRGPRRRLDPDRL